MANRSRHLPCCHGDGLPAIVQGLDPDKGTRGGWRGLQWAWRGWVGRWGSRARHPRKERPRDAREAGSQRHRDTEVPGAWGESLRGLSRADKRMAGYSLGAKPVVAARGWQGCLVHPLPTWPLTPAPPAGPHGAGHPPSAMASQSSPPTGAGSCGTSRPPQPAPSATMGSQAPGSLPGQAKSQAQLRAGTTAASTQEPPAPLVQL